MKNLTITTFSVSFVPVLALADVAPLPDFPAPAAYVSPASGEEFTICTGGTGGAYFQVGAQVAGLLEAYSQQLDNQTVRLSNASPLPGGGTYGCLGKLAAGEVDAAIIQNDGRAILRGISAEFASDVDLGGAVLTEEVLTICSRKNGHEDFGDAGQDRSQLIAVGGSNVSGANVMLNVIAAFDRDFASPAYTYKDSFYAAVKEVADGDADCAVTVMSVDSPTLRQINDDFGDEVRLVGSWDGNFRDLENRGEQVYGWRAIPEDTPGIAKLLSWKGNGTASWSPEVVTVSAVIVYREGLNPELAGLLKQATAASAKLKTDVEE